MAETVGSTRVWLAGILGDWCLLATVHERISSVALQATADRYVIGDIALGILATGSWAGIHALLVQTSLVGTAVGAECALGPAASVGITLVVSQAAADAVVALRIGTARLQITRIGRLNRWLWCALLDNLHALHEWISSEAGTARADRQMILNATLGIDAAGSVTGIATLFGNTGAIGGTIGVHHALWSAVGRSSNVVSQAGAGSLISTHATLGIEAARRGLAGIAILGGFLWLHHLWCWITTGEWITSHVQWATADRVVIDHLALGVQATDAGARISAAELVARLVLRTFRIHCALWLAVGWSSNEVLQAGADSQTVGDATFTVRTTWRWQAGIGNWSRGGWLKATAIREGISGVAIIADAVGHMIDCVALGIRSADAWTRILALVPDASLVCGAVRAEHALWATALVGITLVLIDALAGSCSVAFNALCIGATRRWLAWLRLFRLLLHALHKGIACIAWWTGAGDGVPDDAALGVGAT